MVFALKSPSSPCGEWVSTLLAASSRKFCLDRSESRKQSVISQQEPWSGKLLNGEAWGLRLQPGWLPPQQVCQVLLVMDSTVEKDVGNRVRQNLTIILDVKA